MKNVYDKTIGYSPLDQFDKIKLIDQIKVNVMVIRDFISLKKDARILVAGAGVGIEAVLVSEEFQRNTIGIDLNVSADYLPDQNILVSFQKQDLLHLAFKENTFSLVYCYHVLEHVADQLIVLTEINRVLEPNGLAFIGFPNKNRLISYIGTSQTVTTVQKIKWNLIDYEYRIKGNFENRFGAHAGFTQNEFIFGAKSIFNHIFSVRDKYMLYKYPKWSRGILLISRLGLSEIVYPSNYFVCSKGINE